MIIKSYCSYGAYGDIDLFDYDFSFFYILS